MEQLISNKVYDSIQTPTDSVRNTTGNILYANKYSGVAEVPMPEDLKVLIDSDFGLIGKNILVQLEQKMRGYTNGPWYVDSRDGVIYIHNRKFHEEPVYTYRYQGENGEVLSISFATQKITKRVKAMLAPLVEPETKDLSVLSAEVKEPEGPTPKVETNGPHGVRYSNWTQKSIAGGAENNPGDIFEVQNIGLEQALANDLNFKAISEANKELNHEWNSDYAEYDAKNPAEAYRDGKEQHLRDMKTEELRETINSAIQNPNFPSDKRAALNQVLNNITNGKELEAALRRILEDVKYVFEGEDQMTYMTEEEVDPRDYDPQQESKAPYFGNAYNEGSVNRGIQALKNDPYTEVIDDTPIVKYKNPLNPGAGVFSISVKVKHWKKANVEVSLYKLYHNLFSRYGGVDKWAWAANANANGGLKRTETKLVCQMQVVGRPLLSSSQIIILENVGQRWSGPWYIKQCTHSMDAGQGYICTLELVKSNAKSGSTTAKVGLSTQDIVVNDAKSNAITSKGQDKKSLSNTKELNLNFTYNEVAYFIESGLMDKDGKVLDRKGMDEFAIKKAYYTEVVAKDPIERSEGLVTSSGAKVSSTGKVQPGKLTIKEVQVPEDYWVKFDYMEVAMRNLKEYYKKQKKGK